MIFRFSFLTSLFFLLSTQFLWGQRTLSYEADSIFCEAKELFLSHNYDACLLALEKSNAMFLEDKNWESYIETLAQLGLQTAMLKDSLLGNKYMDKAIRMADSIQLVDKHIHSVVYSVKGNVFYWAGDYKKALFYWEKTLGILKQSRVLDEEYYLIMLSNLGHLYEALGAHEKSMVNHLESVRIAERIFDKGHPLILNIVNKWLEFLLLRREYNKVWNELLSRKSDYESYNDSSGLKADYYLILARYYMAMGDFTEARNYLILAENLYIKIYSPTNSMHHGIYATWAVLEESDGSSEKALPYYKKSLELHKTFPYKTVHSVAILLANVGNCYSNMDMFDEALIYLDEAIATLKESDIDGFYLARVHYYRALMYIRKNDYDLAIDDLEYALNELANDNGSYNEVIGKYSFRIGECYYSKGLYEKAREYYDKGISSFLIRNDENVAFFSVGDKSILSELYTAKIKLAFADTAHDNLAGMKMVLDAAKTVDELLRHMMSDSRSEDYKLSLNEMFHENSNLAVKACHKLLEFTSDENYMDEAFLWSVKGKANLLKAEVKANTDKLKANLPDSLLEIEFKINATISFYEEKLFDPSVDKKDKDWNEILVDLRLEREKLIAHYESFYPKYFELKYSNAEISLKDIQMALDKEESLLDYFVGEDALYIFVIDKKKMHFKRVLLEEDIRETIEVFRQSLKSSDFDTYSKTAYSLYQTLLVPVENHIKGKELYIVPHDMISYLPFDALVSEEPVSKTYHELAYLTKKYDISYLYNSKLMNISRNKSDKKGYLGIVPTYNDDYKPLAFAEKEVDEISTLLSGEKLIGKKATETFVRANANKYDIIHFASHAEIDPDQAMMSRLILEKDAENDGSLYTYELYNMELSSSLVVLNACNTGEGKLYAADGIISLASGFQFAGCKSVFMNLWEVPDQSSSVLVTNFFKHLKEGMCKRSSLSQAKRDYLETSDEYTANPIFWAGGVVSGDLSPIIDANSSMKYYYLASGFLLLIFLFSYVKKLW